MGNCTAVMSDQEHANSTKSKMMLYKGHKGAYLWHGHMYSAIPHDLYVIHCPDTQNVSNFVTISKVPLCVKMIKYFINIADLSTL